MSLLRRYRVLKAKDICELPLFTVSTSGAFDEISRPFLLHIEPETERANRNIFGVVKVNLYVGSHLRLDAFDANSIVPAVLGFPLLELSGFGRQAPCHNIELESEVK